MRKINVLAALGAVLALAAFGQVALAAPPHFEGFEDAGWVANLTGNWQNYGGATIARVASGTNGIASAGGSAHAVLTPGTGPFTPFGGYSSVFGAGFVASLDMYLNPQWESGKGFDYSVAATRQTGAHLRDFIWHVGVVDNQLLVNASNNSDWTFNSWKLLNENSGSYFTVSSAGWYTFEQVFYDSGGALAVDFNLKNSGGTILNSWTRTNAADSTATVAGGNRYGWFAYNNIDGLAIDNTSLMAPSPDIPEPMSMILGAMGLVSIAGFRGLRRK